MILKEILPSEKLKPYIKCFYLYTADSDLSFDDIVFPSGNMELIFNLGEGHWQVNRNNTYYTTPPVELWGQITRPLAIRSIGNNTMLGIRFYVHSAAYFFDADVSVFNNEVVDGADGFGMSIKTLHTTLLSTTDLDRRIVLIENYLLHRLAISGGKHTKINFVGAIADTLKHGDNNDKIASVSVRNNISTRYLNRLFTQYTGLSPKLFCKINRFQRSLNLINSSSEKLTSIGYDAGYFDQSHFIREFKLFTGITPTSFYNQSLPVNQVLAQSRN